MKKVEMNLNGSTLSIETGHVARQSAGSVIVTHGETSAVSYTHLTLPTILLV